MPKREEFLFGQKISFFVIFDCFDHQKVNSSNLLKHFRFIEIISPKFKYVPALTKAVLFKHNFDSHLSCSDILYALFQMGNPKYAIKGVVQCHCPTLWPQHAKPSVCYIIFHDLELTIKKYS